MARGFGAAAFAVAAVLAAGCSGGAHSAGKVEVVPVELSNFKIQLPSQLHAGTVRFDLDGVGPTMHEFNIARSDLPSGELPTSADGLVEDEAHNPNLVFVTEREGIDIGDHESMTVKLTPGRYVLYCNMYGHYEAGMHAAMTVT